jgi:hypothetical protein
MTGQEYQADQPGYTPGHRQPGPRRYAKRFLLNRVDTAVVLDPFLARQEALLDRAVGKDDVLLTGRGITHHPIIASVLTKPDPQAIRVEVVAE